MLMRIVRRAATLTTGVAMVGLWAVLLIPSAALAARDNQLDLELCDPEENTFTTEIDNTYFPLPIGQEWVLIGEDEGVSIGLWVTVTGRTETFYRGPDRVETLEVEELEWEDANQDGIVDPDESLIEISLNYFAQTREGTVCYFGESVDIYEDGVVVSHEGEWRADEGDNAPGIFMPANPEVGMTYQQELAPGVAEDTATIVRIGRTVTVPAGTFTNTLRVRDVNPLDGDFGIKIYAPDVGIIRDGPVDLISLTGPTSSSDEAPTGPTDEADGDAEVHDDDAGDGEASRHGGDRIERRV